MCGIIGIISKNFEQNSNRIKITYKILHRGPDSYGFWNSEDKSVSFGHTRLSIIDLSANNNQPYYDEEVKLH